MRGSALQGDGVQQGEGGDATARPAILVPAILVEMAVGRWGLRQATRRLQRPCKPSP